jgi:hypothetical protein
MNEHVIAFFRSDEAITLTVVEPLYCTLQFCTPFTLGACNLHDSPILPVNLSIPK